jgi:hypothetical protein
MKPVRASAFDDSAPVDRRGKRLPETIEAIALRDALLREAAARFCAGMTPFQAAQVLHVKLLRYQTSAWQRHRSAEECPPRLAGRDGELLWQILKARDHVLCAAMIEAVLKKQ